MPFPTKAIVGLVATFLLVPQTFSLKVTPNSPCSSVCIDSLDLNTSDPNSSHTKGDDIVCDDKQFDTKPNGSKFKKCLSCLQTSTFNQGSESDQAWFLYNLRYAFNYCIFGYPNATGIGSNPCATSEACGRLANALEDGITDASTVQRLGYCDVNGGVVTGSYYESCLQCVQADGTHRYLSNFFIALQAGCKQKPPTNIAIGLNETIFTTNTIQFTDPSASASPEPSSGIQLNTPAIVGIVIGAIVVVGLLAGCLFMQLHKRKNRNSRSRRILPFRCKTPQQESQPQYQDDYDDDRFFEKDELSPNAAMASMSPVARSKPFTWEHIPIDTKDQSVKTSQKQLNIETALPAPQPAYTSPRMTGFSPDDYTPPTSTISTKSSASLLNNKPSKYSISPSLASASSFGGVSPALSQTQFQNDGSPVHQEARAGSFMGLDMGRKAKKTPSNSPVRTIKIQTVFPPPPAK